MVWHFIEHFTYIGLFFSLFGSGLGIPIPEGAVLVSAGVLTHEALVRWWVALPICVLGAASGDILLYLAGRHWSERILEWGPVRRVLSPDREATLLEAYRRHGVKVVFATRHVMGLRATASLTAGIARIPFWKFVTVDLATVVVTVAAVFGLAFLFTDQVKRVMADVHRLEHWLTLLTLLTVTIALVYLGYHQAPATRHARQIKG